MKVLLVKAGDEFKMYSADQIIDGKIENPILIANRMADIDLDTLIKYTRKISDCMTNMIGTIVEISRSMYKNIDYEKFAAPIDDNLEYIDYNMTQNLSMEEYASFDYTPIKFNLNVEKIKKQAERYGRSINVILSGDITGYVDAYSGRHYKYEKVIDGALVISKYMSVYDGTCKLQVIKYIGIVKKFY